MLFKLAGGWGGVERGLTTLEWSHANTAAVADDALQEIKKGGGGGTSRGRFLARGGGGEGWGGGAWKGGRVMGAVRQGVAKAIGHL